MPKKLIWLIVLWAIMTGCVAGDTRPTGQLDFSGVDAFWPIHSELLADRSPAEEAWDTLFDTPGYAILVQRDFTREFLTDFFSLAYQPSRRDELEAELQKTGFRIQYLRHLTALTENKQTLLARQRELEENPVILTDALALTQEYLTEPIDVDRDPPPVSFVFFGNDARGYSRVIVDFLYAVQKEVYLRYLLAHEAHHYYRRRLLTFDEPPEGSMDAALLWGLDQLQAEGIADQIDKRVIYFGEGIQADSRRAIQFREFLDQAPTHIARFDSLLANLVDFSGDPERLETRIRFILPMSAHPTGYFMANIIRQELGKEILREHVGNPFAFLRDYNEAATRSPNRPPVFSTESLRRIDELEERYGRLSG